MFLLRACQARRASTQQIDDSKWNHVSSSTVSAATLPAHGEWQGLVLPPSAFDGIGLRPAEILQRPAGTHGDVFFYIIITYV